MAEGSCEVRENPFAQHTVKYLTKHRITELLRELMSILVIKHQLAKNDTLAASRSDANTFAVPLTICPATRYYNLLG